MQRRQFIAAAALGCTAGCSQLGSSQDPETTASFTDAPAQSSTDAPDGLTQHKAGQKYRWASETRVTVEEVRLARTVKFGSGPGVQASDGTALLMAKIHASNPSDGTTQFPEDGKFTLIADGDQYQPLAPAPNETPRAVVDFPTSGPVYLGGSSANPGVTEKGWLLFEVPDATTSVRLMLAGKTSPDPVAYWEGTVDPSTVPKLDVQSIEAPEELVNGAPADITISVKNTGGSTGILNRSVAVIPEEGESQKGFRLQARVSSDETVQIKHSISAFTPQNLTVAIPPDTRKTISVVPAQRTFGTPYTLSSGVQVEVAQPILTETVLVERGWDPLRRGEISGIDLAVVEITAWNPTDDAQPEPGIGAFEIEALGKVDDSPERPWDKGLLEPIDREFYDGRTESTIASSGSLSGALYYRVPPSAELDDVVYRGRFPTPGSGKEICEWSAE